jgi:hypothetical protein
MKLVFLGAEVGSNRVLLESMGVKTMGISYSRIVKRGEPKTKKWLISERFDDDAIVVVNPGLTETDGMTVGELEAFARAYQEFVYNNESRISGVVEFTPEALGIEWAARQRANYVDLEERFWPVWNPLLGFKDLVELGEEYQEIAIPGAEVLNNSAHQIVGHMRAATRAGTSFHGLGVSSPESLHQSPLATASTLSWTQAMRNGETIVWDGTRLVRYPARMKDQARPRYKSVIEQAGLDFDAIMADDPKEITRLAIWSYQQVEKNMDKKVPDLRIVTESSVTNSDSDEIDLRGISDLDVTNRVVPTVKSAGRIPTSRSPQERAILPSVRVDSTTIVERLEDGTEVLREAPVIKSTGTSLRQCNSCFVAANCPAFTPDAECAFSLPVEIKTKEQLVSLLNAMIEMQASRVAFARFGEELNGGYPDPNVSQEIDRLFKLVERVKKLEDNKEFVRMTLERQGGAGILSNIFGSRAGILKELDSGPVTSDQVIRQTLEEQ